MTIDNWTRGTARRHGGDGTLLVSMLLLLTGLSQSPVAASEGSDVPNQEEAALAAFYRALTDGETGPTKCGPLTSPTSRWHRGSGIASSR